MGTELNGPNTEADVTHFDEDDDPESFAGDFADDNYDDFYKDDGDEA